MHSSSIIRRDEIEKLVRKLYRSSGDEGFVKVELKPMLWELVFDITMRMIAGKKYTCDEVGGKLLELIQELLEVGISPDIGDFFPFLGWVDLRGYKKEVMKITSKIDVFLQGLIDEHRRYKDVFEKENTVISRLLCLQEMEAQYYTDTIIKGIVQDMLLGGLNTVVITLEWSMSHLLNNLNTLQKTKSELDVHVGDDRLLDETDLPKLRYLQNVISETLRLNPPVPLLVPHVSSDHCTILGFDIPIDTILLVNVWAIQRDPKLWDEATDFKPERFDNGRIEGYKMMPFGLGRRGCPGIDLGQRVVGLALGALIQCFEWKRVSSRKIDMAEGKGLNLPKAEPLQALCKARNTAKKLLF